VEAGIQVTDTVRDTFDKRYPGLGDGMDAGLRRQDGYSLHLKQALGLACLELVEGSKERGISTTPDRDINRGETRAAPKLIIRACARRLQVVLLNAVAQSFAR